MSKILIFGDSYVNHFQKETTDDVIVKTYFGFKAVDLADKKTINWPVSQKPNTNVYNDIKTIIEQNIKNIDRIIFCFGVNDIHLQYYRDVINGRSYDLNNFIETYLSFLENINKIINNGKTKVPIFVFNILPFFFRGTNRQLKNVYERILKQQIKGYNNVFNLRRQNEYLMIANLALKNRLRSTPFTFVEINKHIEKRDNPLAYLNVFYNPKPYDFHISFIPFIHTIIHETNIGLTVDHIKKNSYLVKENIITNNWKSMVEYLNTWKQNNKQKNRIFKLVRKK